MPLVFATVPPVPQPSWLGDTILTGLTSSCVGTTHAWDTVTSLAQRLTPERQVQCFLKSDVFEWVGEQTLVWVRGATSDLLLLSTDWILCGGGAAVERHIGTRPIALMWTAESVHDRQQLLRIEGKGMLAPDLHVTYKGLQASIPLLYIKA
jgi:hypothetical protein